MAYSAGALKMLAEWVGSILPFGGRVLELGSQDINRDVGEDVIREALSRIHGPNVDLDALIQEHSLGSESRKIASLFEGSSIGYSAIDLYAGHRVSVADLNTFSVAEGDRGTIDLVTNFGTSEHVADQINVFRVVHDFVKPNGHMFHTVPFAGYYNHGLYNYHPVFFFFLAWANNYRIITLNLSSPHLPHSIPVVDWLPGSNHWKSIRIESGMVSCLLQKIENKPFALFTDLDRSVIKADEEPDKYRVLEGRYDLRVR